MLLPTIVEASPDKDRHGPRRLSLGVNIPINERPSRQIAAKLNIDPGPTALSRRKRRLSGSFLGNSSSSSTYRHTDTNRRSSGLFEIPARQALLEPSLDDSRPLDPGLRRERRSSDSWSRPEPFLLLGNSQNNRRKSFYYKPPNSDGQAKGCVQRLASSSTSKVAKSSKARNERRKSIDHQNPIPSSSRQSIVQVGNQTKTQGTGTKSTPSYARPTLSSLRHVKIK